MQEFWFCEACKSMNRASVQQCYRCHAPKSVFTMATVQQRVGAVLTPGLDEEHREVAWALMVRQTYISAWRLGYLSAALLGFVILAGIAWLAAEIVTMVSLHSLYPILFNDHRTNEINVAWVLLAGTFLFAAIVHSVFLGLTSMDAPALGSGSPRFDTYRAFLWWIEATLWWFRAALAFVIPPLLFLAALILENVVFGVLLGIVWTVCAFWLLGDPITSLGKPRRLLADLYERLGVPGASDARIVTYWAAAWGTARGIVYAIAAVIWIVGIAMVVLVFFGRPLSISFDPAPQNQSDAALTLLIDVGAVIEVLAEGTALLLLMRITIELARRQRTREQWVLGGADAAIAQAEAQAAAVAAAGSGAAAAVRAARDRANMVAGTPLAPPVPPVPPVTTVPPELPVEPHPASRPGHEPVPAAEPDAAPGRRILQPSKTAFVRYGSPPGDPPES